MNYKHEVRKTLVRLGGSKFAKFWLNHPCPSLKNMTPNQVIEQGNGNIVLKIVDDLYKYGDRDEFAKTKREPP